MKVLSRARCLLQVVFVPLLVLTVLPAWGPWPDSPAGAARRSCASVSFCF